jgi:ABC-type ATPase involved in cell division
MVMEPRVLLADEPSGHQDADWAATVFQAFRWIADKGTSCLVATHSHEFLKLVDRVVAMRDGRWPRTHDPRRKRPCRGSGCWSVVPPWHSLYQPSALH